MDISNGYINGIGLQTVEVLGVQRPRWIWNFDWLIDFVTLGGSEWKEEGTAKDQDI